MSTDPCHHQWLFTSENSFKSSMNTGYCSDLRVYELAMAICSYAPETNERFEQLPTYAFWSTKVSIIRIGKVMVSEFFPLKLTEFNLKPPGYINQPLTLCCVT